MAVKVKLSYEHDKELQDIIVKLEPRIEKVKPSRNKEGKYKKAYIYLKQLE